VAVPAVSLLFFISLSLLTISRNSRNIGLISLQSLRFSCSARSAQAGTSRNIWRSCHRFNHTAVVRNKHPRPLLGWWEHPKTSLCGSSCAAGRNASPMLPRPVALFALNHPQSTATYLTVAAARITALTSAGRDHAAPRPPNSACVLVSQEDGSGAPRAGAVSSRGTRRPGWHCHRRPFFPPIARPARPSRQPVTPELTTAALPP
jgi:hypothetical protein